MSLATNLCRLCVQLCGEDSRKLYNETGQINETYEITVKYFHPMFLNVDHGKDSTVMCSQCWQHISDFYTYQESVFEAQRKLLIEESEIELPSEKCNGTESSENTNGDDNPVIKCEEDTVSLPDLELMEDYTTYDDNAQFRVDLEASLDKDQLLENASTIVNSLDSQQVDTSISKVCKNDSRTVEQSNQSTIQYKLNSRRKKYELDRKIAQWRPILKCEICDETFSSFTLMQLHFRQEHPEQQCYISCCDRIFRHRYRIEEHARFHIDPNAFCCHLCKVRHTSGSSLYIHNRIHHLSSSSSKEVRPSICEPQKKKRRVRKRGYRKMSVQQIDVLIAQYMPNIECVVCHEFSTSFTLLKYHFAHQHPSEEFYVMCCQRKFINRSTLKEHIQIHLDPDAFKCKECEKNNTSYRNLQMHMQRMHYSQEKPEIQSVSNQTKRIRQRKSFKTYDEIIAKWKPYLECVVCHRSYKSYSKLQSHFRQHHSHDEFYIICCQRKLINRPAVLEHIQLHRNPDAFKCQLCEKCYSYRNSYNEHMLLQHPEVDEACYLRAILVGKTKCVSITKKD